MKYLKLFNESLTQEQVDEVSDLFIEVADEFGLNESIDGRGDEYTYDFYKASRYVIGLELN